MKNITKLLKILSKEGIEIIDKVCCRNCGFSIAYTDNPIVRTRQALDYIYGNYPSNIKDLLSKNNIPYKRDGSDDKAIQILELNK